MKNMEAWAYVKKIADWYGAVDSESVAQEALLKRWDKDLPRGYWASCGRNGAHRQFRDEGKHIALRQVLSANPDRDVTESDFDSRLMIEGLRENEPSAFQTVVQYLFDAKVRHTNQERKAVEHSRRRLREWAYGGA